MTILHPVPADDFTSMDDDALAAAVSTLAAHIHRGELRSDCPGLRPAQSRTLQRAIYATTQRALLASPLQNPHSDPAPQTRKQAE